MTTIEEHKKAILEHEQAIQKLQKSIPISYGPKPDEDEIYEAPKNSHQFFRRIDDGIEKESCQECGDNSWCIQVQFEENNIVTMCLSCWDATCNEFRYV